MMSLTKIRNLKGKMNKLYTMDFILKLTRLLMKKISESDLFIKFNLALAREIVKKFLLYPRAGF